MNYASDPDGDTLTASLVSNVSHGTLHLYPDGSFTYWPTQNWYGTDSFVYQVSDGKGGTTTATITLNVYNLAPVAGFTYNTKGHSVSVDAVGSYDADGQITNYAWDFGDGTTTSGKTASHHYSKSGAYTITLTVTDNQGATSTISKQVSL